MPSFQPELNEERIEKEETQPLARDPQEPAMCFCPVCSTRLLSSRCKLVCEQCGYFMSCADYY